MLFLCGYTTIKNSILAKRFFGEGYMLSELPSNIIETGQLLLFASWLNAPETHSKGDTLYD
ncbi:hypothetical protein NTGM5_10058 [Candidatus Nitrotoga sp. M5]|nr:hypothetical protein NTGM5_10058 [Candidatus Nitrotoga sp. M5]